MFTNISLVFSLSCFSLWFKVVAHLEAVIDIIKDVPHISLHGCELQAGFHCFHYLFYPRAGR